MCIIASNKIQQGGGQQLEFLSKCDLRSALCY